MKILNSIPDIRAQRWADPTLTWGFVPTMGYLHQGHISLVERAAAENDRVMASIYVNPTQFAAGEDLSTYPRALERDAAMLEAAGCDVLFTPSDEVMYPEGFQTIVEVTEVTKKLEGASRPDHFGGVTQIVAKLFNIAQPTRAYFGQKDFQQTVVLKRMVKDLNFNLDLIVCPTMREVDGLAMSSRNKYLNEAEREQATVLSRALKQAQRAYASGEKSADKLRLLMETTIALEPLAKLDYLSIAHPLRLDEEQGDVTAGAIASMAVFFGKTRLIDNMELGEIRD